MLMTQSISLVALTLGGLTWSGDIQLWHIYALTAIQAGAMAFDLPARQSLVPNLVPRADLPSAFSLQSIAFNTGSIVGPAMSGVVIGYLGQEYVYLINAATFLGVIIALILLGPVPQSRSAVQRGLRAAWTDIGAGVTFIRKQPLILSTMILDFIATFFASANTLLPFFAQNILHIGEVAYGWLAAAQSIGAVMVGIIASQYRQIRNQGILSRLVVLAGYDPVWSFASTHHLPCAGGHGRGFSEHDYSQYDSTAQYT
jgi:MFS family permease